MSSKVDEYLQQADSAYLNQAYDDASDNYQHAVDIDHANVSAWIGLAKTFIKLGSDSRANEYIDKAMKLEPTNLDVLLYAGIIKMQTHDYFHAVSYLEQAVQQPEGTLFPFAKFYLGLIDSRQDFFAKALDLFKECAQMEAFADSTSPNYFALMNNLALVQFRLGNYNDAEQIFADLTATFPTNSAAVWVNLAQIYWIQDKLDECTNALIQANSIDPQSWPWMDELAKYRETGAQGLKEQLSALKTENPNGLNISLYLGCIIPNRYPYIEAATRYFLDAFDIGVADLPGASCCPAPGVFRSFDIDTWMTLGARNITLSEDINRDLITMCNGCYGTLNDVNTQLKEDPSKKAKVNEHLKKINKEYKGSQRVRHIVEIIYNDIGLENIKKRIIKPLGLNIAVHYGCHVLKPHDNKPWKTGCEDPTFLDEMVEVAGCKSIPYKDKLMCCGAGGAVRTGMKETSIDFTKEKLMNMRNAGVDAVVLCCPFCALQFDLGQTECNNTFKDQIGELFQIPILYITQLLGLAMGMDPYKMGILKTPKVKGVPPYVPFEPIFTKYQDLNI